MVVFLETSWNPCFRRERVSFMGKMFDLSFRSCLIWYDVSYVK